MLYTPRILFVYSFYTLMPISLQVIQSENLAAVVPSSEQRGAGDPSLMGTAVFAWHLQPSLPSSPSSPSSPSLTILAILLSLLPGGISCTVPSSTALPAKL